MHLPDMTAEMSDALTRDCVRKVDDSGHLPISGELDARADRIGRARIELGPGVSFALFGDEEPRDVQREVLEMAVSNLASAVLRAASSAGMLGGYQAGLREIELITSILDRHAETNFEHAQAGISRATAKVGESN